MTILNLGSINADLFYRLPHFAKPGETLAALGHSQGLGGKGANMSVAAARAGAAVSHIGAVGSDGEWATRRLADEGINVDHIAVVDTPTGHAIIMVEDGGENAIVLYPGANLAITETQVASAFHGFGPSDTLILQNETNAQPEATKLARSKGMRIAYAAAPFDAQAVSAVMKDLDWLFMNQVESEQLQSASGVKIADLPVGHVVVTLGADGCRIYDNSAQTVSDYASPRVSPVDTTGAGDTFTGFMLAGLDQGLSVDAAANQALIAGAIMVKRQGTADVIPTLADVHAF